MLSTKYKYVNKYPLPPPPKKPKKPQTNKQENEDISTLYFA